MVDKNVTGVVGVGIIGLGYWGPNLVRNFFRQNVCNLIGLCDLDPARLKRQLDIYPSVEGTQDAFSLIDSPKVDVVVICTPPSSHYDLAMRAISAGKDVYIAKPITLIPEEAYKLAEFSDENDRILHVDHTFVYTPAVRKLKEILDQNGFGPLNYVESTRINLGLFQQDTNVVWDLAPHDLSILDYILGKSPHTVVAHTNNPIANSYEHLAYVSMYYDQGLIVNLNLNWLSPVKVRRTIFGGTRNMIIYDDMENDEKIKVFQKGVEVLDVNKETHSEMVQYRVGDVYSPFVENHEALDLECREFLEAVINRKQTPTSGLAGYNVVRLCDAIDRSMKDGGAHIQIQ